jgi:hypothetical protein
MAQDENYTRFTVYRSETAATEPPAERLGVGELAVNITDKKIYTKNSSSEVVDLTSVASGTTQENDGNVINNGSVTNNGDTIHNGDTSLNGDVLVDGNTLENYINSIINSGSAPGSDGQHRYWRIGFGGTVTGSARITDMSIWTGGQGFKNGRRWNKGVLVTLPTELGSITNFTADGGSNGPSNNGWRGFLTGESIAGVSYPNATFSYSTTPPATDARVGVEIDFGEGNEVHISGIDINGSNAGGTETVDVVEFSYSDNGSDWTVASTVSGIKESTGADVDSTIDLPHIGNIGDTTPNTLFDESKATIPFLDTSGGGGGGSDYWTFDYTIRDATFTPADGTYYFVAGSSLDDFTVSLPTASNGTRVGFCYASDTQGAGTLAVTIEDDSSNVVGYVGRQPSEIFPSALFDQGNFITNIELVYAGGGWRVMNVFTYFYVG